MSDNLPRWLDLVERSARLIDPKSRFTRNLYSRAIPWLLADEAFHQPFRLGLIEKRMPTEGDARGQSWATRTEVIEVLYAKPEGEDSFVELNRYPVLQERPHLGLLASPRLREFYEALNGASSEQQIRDFSDPMQWAHVLSLEGVTFGILTPRESKEGSQPGKA